MVGGKPAINQSGKKMYSRKAIMITVKTLLTQCDPIHTAAGVT